MINDLRRVWKELRDFRSGLAVSREFPPCAEKLWL